MSDHRTDTEKILHTLLLDVQGYLLSNVLTRSDFTYVSGSLRDAVKMLANKEAGCPTGRHYSTCLCQAHFYVPHTRKEKPCDPLKHVLKS